MTTKYFAILTNQGAARLANATMLGTKLNITQMAVGDGNGTLPTPDPAQTKLINQTRIAPINSLSVDAHDAGQIIAEQIIPENEGGFFIREIGLYDDDGILIAVANCPETYKPLLAEGSGRTQTIRIILVVSSTSAITLKIDPSVVLATRKYVDDAVIEVKSYADGLMRNHEQSRNHPDATTTAKGFTQLNSSVTDDRETQSATPKAVKIAMDNANARLAKERNLADLPNPALARQNLQLGDSSTKNTGTTANTVAAGDDARITGAMQKSQNGADIPDVAKFLQNLQLGEAAKRNVGTGANQIPDMSSFQSGAGWQILPGGLIIQSCIVSIPVGSWSGGANGWSQSQTVEIALPVPFPNALIGASAALINGGTAWEWVQTYHINFAQKGLNLTGHAPANNIPNQTVQYSVIVLGR
ncbi:phage tail protein [Citrobacter freundii complex sp. 2024EL-00237]|uniref:phage tail protein n=1 Tax=Citrobacter freundii complex sp. 2024EL-00237 TaxID=3374253 RepID=UPI0037500A55